ncbi:hypothetical protein TYRP_017028 [Tyrophagus putrescentiae]|nr:hypothetical protein TYRP_017028 [Tyrophagus putrescentiae]
MSAASSAAEEITTNSLQQPVFIVFAMNLLNRLVQTVTNHLGFLVYYLNPLVTENSSIRVQTTTQSSSSFSTWKNAFPTHRSTRAISRKRRIMALKYGLSGDRFRKMYPVNSMPKFSRPMCRERLAYWWR